MRGVVLAGLLALGPFTAGCAARVTAPTPAEAPQPVPGTCDASKARFAIGEPLSADLVARARAAAQAHAIRVIRPNDAVTMDFVESRLNLHLDDRDVVRSVKCG